MKRISKIAAAVLSLTTMLGCTACNRKSEDVTIDKSKMQLYVKYYNGGYGDVVILNASGNSLTLDTGAHKDEATTIDNIAVNVSGAAFDISVVA